MPRFRNLLPKLSSRAATADGFLRFLALSVVCAVVCRYCWIDYQDPFKCSALLNNGTWLVKEEECNTRPIYRNWQPPGCMLHEYKKEEIRTCLEKRRMVVVGDSTTRQIFWAIASKLDAARAQREMEEFLDKKNKAFDIDFTHDGITVQFIWDPYLNSSTLETELQAFRKSAHHESVEDAATVEDAALILLGAPGLWYARKGNMNYLREYKETLDRLVPYMDHSSYSQTSYADWTVPSIKDPARNLLLMAPVREPWYPSLSPSRRESLTPERIDPLNEHLLQLSSWQDADIAWSFANMTWQLESMYQDSGFHVVREVAKTEAEVLLNLRCNAASAERGVYPHDGTCCMNYRPRDWRQNIIILTALLAAFMLWMIRRKHILSRARLMPSPEVLRPLSAFVLILCFCFFADRTQLFAKERKMDIDIGSICIIITVVGLLSVRKGTLSVQKPTSGPQSQPGQESLFLSRNQTEEWKGIMQALLLVFHYSSASRALWVYELSRIFVAGYLFMTGYGHTLYFLSTNDYSLNRVAHVLIKLNLFVCTLAYMMRTEYTFYHFAPLVSFWFIVVYYVLRIKQSLNTQPTYLLLKILLFSCLVSSVILLPSILESIFIVLKFTFRVGWDLARLRQLISHDLLIVYLGMTFAIISLRISTLSTQPPPSPSIIDTPLNFFIRRSSLLKPIFALLALIILPAYWHFTVVPHTKSVDYDKLHNYLSFIPILCFLALRNLNPLLQTHYAFVFAWLGRHSLELYLLQHHIWLAGDSQGILLLGIRGRKTESILITILFLWAAAGLRDSVTKLGEWIISGKVRVVGRKANGDGNQWGRSEPRGLGIGMEEVNDYNDAIGWVDYSIPAGEGTLSKNYRFRPLKMVGDTRVRVGVLMLLAWILNLTYC